MSDRGASDRALRLRFEYDGRTMRQVARIPVNMMVVPSDATQGYRGHTGFWYELQDAAGKTIYRRVIHDPTIPYREVSSPDGTFTHVASQDLKTFDAIVPDVSEGADVVFFASGHPEATQVRSAVQGRHNKRDQYRK